VTGAAYIAIALFFAIVGGLIARSKGSSFFIWFLICGILPGLGLIAAILYRWDRDEPRRACPRCGRITKLHDAICTRCGAELDFPDEVLPPESAVAG
jgi:hypothetical protein